MGILVVGASACGSCSESADPEATEAVADDEQAPTDETAEQEAAATETEDPEVPDGQVLSFSIEGGRLDGKQFDMQVSGALGFWLYDPAAGRTMISARDQAHGLDAFLHVSVPMEEAGTYEFQAGSIGADSLVQLRFRDSDADEKFALLAVEGQLELQEPVDDMLVGSFGGKFVYSSTYNTKGIKDVPEDQREYATVTDGRVAVEWKDRIGGKARRWGQVASR